MDEQVSKVLKEETQIPEQVLTKIISGRKQILQGEILQEKPVDKPKLIGKIVFGLAVAASITLILVTKNPVSSAIENAFGISRDSGVATIERNGIDDQLDLVSSQNGQEIKLTKFVATKKKLAFDYQFEIEDAKLKDLLDKKLAAGVNRQDIQLGLFAEGDEKDIFGGLMMKSTFAVKDNTFYGSVVATFTKAKIPENSQLTLHIYELAWVDQVEFEQIKAEAQKNHSDFTVPYALVYQGNWQYRIDNPVLTQVAKTEVFNINQVSDIKTHGDALQTSVAFSVPAIEGDEINPNINVKTYKNGVEVAVNSMITKKIDDQQRFEMSIDLSALDTSSIYQVKIFQVNYEGDTADEIASFELKNK